MQPSKFDEGFYCPAKVGKHPQTGKAIYCRHKAEAAAT